MFGDKDIMDKDQMVVVETRNNNNHHDGCIGNNKVDEEDDVTKSSVAEADAEVNSIISKSISEVEQGNDSTSCSSLPPRKIAKRCKDSSSRRSASSLRIKTPTPLSMLSTPLSCSERELNSSPASTDNPPTNGSINNDAFGDGERSDRESVDSQSVSSSTCHGSSTNGPSNNHLSSTFTKRSVTLRMLLAAGILKPGVGTMSLEYHGQKFIGDLKENGNIKSQETSQEFASPSAWATACKLIINPDKIQRKSGGGWGSIKYKGLKLDYYKTVWFKRVREGSIDINQIANGSSIGSDDEDEEDVPFCILKYGEHLENNPVFLSALQIGAKVMVGCTRFQEIERLQPFYVEVCSEALALADFHCNLTGAESLGYISGTWSSDSNCLRMEKAHPCKVISPNSTSVDCDTERNRIAVEIQRIGHDVVGWYHSHPKAPPQPSRDDISRQLDYQIVMKGASELSYIPCVGVIISPLCYTTGEALRKSPIQFFWVMPPPENRPLELGRPMHIDYETYSPSKLDMKKLLLEIASLIQFYKTHKDTLDINDLTNGKFEKLQDSFSSILPEVQMNADFWEEVKQLFQAPVPTSSYSSTESSRSSVSSSALNINSVPTPNSPVSSSTPPVMFTPTRTSDTSPSIDVNENGKT